jgi:peptide chain release factor 1
VLLGHVPDQLLDDDRLAHTGAAEDPDLAALLERADQVNDLEAGLEDLHLGGLVVEAGRIAVDGEHRVGRDRALAVDRLAQDVEDTAQRDLADRHGDRRPGVADRDAAGETVRGGHRDAADPVVAQVLLDLADERLAALAEDLDRVEDRGQLACGELDVDHRTGDLDDPAGRFGSCGGGCHRGVSLLVSAAGRRSRSRSSRG